MATIKNKLQKIMLDTGAEISITNVQHDLQPDSPQCVVTGFDHQQGGIRASRIDEVAVQINNDFTLKIPMWYYSGSDNIIGTDIMAQNGWILDLANCMVWKGPRNSKVCVIKKHHLGPPIHEMTSTVNMFVHKWPEVSHSTDLEPIVYKYPELWAQDKNDCGKMIDVQVDIQGPDPPPQRQYRFPPEAMEPVIEAVTDLESRGVVIKGNSKCNNPLWPVKKKETNTWRLTIDLRVLNKYTPMSAQVVAETPDILARINGKSKVFSTLDVANGFFSISLTESCRYKFAFTVQDTQYIFCVLPQGFHSSPTYFHQALAKVLRVFSRPECLLQFVDDLLLHTESMEEHLTLLQELLGLLVRAGLKLSPHKANLARPEVIFLGVKIAHGTKGIMATRVEAMIKLPRPSTLQDLRKFLGVVNFMREFIEDFAAKAKPLYELLRGEEPSLKGWAEAQEEAFSTLKRDLSSAPVLATPHPEGELAIQAHAGPESISAVLLQQVESVIRPLGYFSRLLSPVERGFDECAKQLAAIHYAVKVTEHIVGFRPLTIQTPHSPLNLLFRDMLPGVSQQRFGRWIMDLSGHNLKVSHKAKYVLSQLLNTTETEHDCGQMPHVKTRPLFRQTTCPDDRVIFVDGSRSHMDGTYVTGYAVLDKTTGLQSLIKLPGHLSAQRAELEAVKEALLLQPPGPRTIYSDSSYVVRSLTLHLDTWQRRGFVDSQNKPLAHVSMLKELWEFGRTHPEEAAIIKVPAHQKGNDPLVMGNNSADEAAKLAAVSGIFLDPDNKNVSSFKIMVRSKILEEGPVSFEEEQAKDPFLTPHINSPQDPWSIRQGILCHTSNECSKPLPVVPTHLQVELTRLNHQLLGHPGRDKLMSLLKDKLYWSGMSKTVEMVTQQCLVCAQVNPRAPALKPVLQRVPPSEGPWAALQIDFIGPLPAGSRNCRYALVVVDIFSKWVEAIPTVNDTATTTARVLWEQILSRWGVPRIIESDRGTHFTGKVMKALCELLDIKQRFHVPYHPQSAGIVERMNRTIKSRLAKALLGKGSSWVNALPSILMGIRATEATTTGITPFELMTGRKMPLCFPNEPQLSNPIKEAIARDVFLQQVQDNLKELLPYAATRLHKPYLQGETHMPPVGSLVMVKTFRKAGPWDANWEGPYQVLEILGDTILKVQRPMTAKRDARRRRKVLLVHIDQVKATQASLDQ